jgi:ribose transport system permease protein
VRQGPQFFSIIAVLIVGALLSPYFLTGNNFRNILITGSVVSVLAVGQFMVIVTAGIDLSVGAVASFSTVLSAVLMTKGGVPGVWTVFITLAVCACFGIVNGVLVVYGGITPFIATLGMMGVVQGLAYLVQGGTYVRINSQGFVNFFSGHLGSIPVQVIIFVVIMAVFAAIMRWSTFGRALYAIGGNAEASRLSGLPVRRNLVATYALSSMLAAGAGFMLAAQLGEGSSQLGQGLELDSIAAAVVGGASLFGGLGSPAAAVLGGLLIGVIGNIMNLRGVPAEPQLIIKGSLILLAVFVTSGRGATIRTAIVKAVKGNAGRRRADRSAAPLAASPPSAADRQLDEPASGDVAADRLAHRP